VVEIVVGNRPGRIAFVVAAEGRDAPGRSSDME